MPRNCWISYKKTNNASAKMLAGANLLVNVRFEQVTAEKHFKSKQGRCWATPFLHLISCLSQTACREYVHDRCRDQASESLRCSFFHVGS